MVVSASSESPCSGWLGSGWRRPRGRRHRLPEVPPPPPPPNHGPPAVVDVQETTTYGPILVATFTGAKLPLYEISSDRLPVFGCTTAVASTFQGTVRCTGPETFTTTGPTASEWPALTTGAPPVAGPGVARQLLGTVNRPGVGVQVTYGGHPLYLFTQPTTFGGEGFLETVLPLPPWHGLWDLVSALNGEPASGPAVITSGTLLTGAKVVSAKEYPVAVTGGVAVAAYEFCASPPAPPHPGGAPSPSTSCPPAPNPPGHPGPGPHGPGSPPGPPGPGVPRVRAQPTGSRCSPRATRRRTTGPRRPRSGPWRPRRGHR